MKKRIIFDVDDTLIPWEMTYYKELRKILKENGIKLSFYRFYKVLKGIDKYEKTHDSWNKEEFCKYLSEISKVEINDEYFLLILKWLEDCVYTVASDEIKKTLKNLQKNYDLVVLSNSFKIVQVKRLEKFGILKYFKEIYGGDEIMKPNKKAYLLACGNCNPKDCFMVGDNLEYDCIAPQKLGITPIYVSKKKHKNIITIKNVEELINIL